MALEEDIGLDEEQKKKKKRKCTFPKDFYYSYRFLMLEKTKQVKIPLTEVFEFELSSKSQEFIVVKKD